VPVKCSREICVAERLRDEIRPAVEVSGLVEMGDDD
jgi:hypothetical protein